MSRINSLLTNGTDESFGDIHRALPTMSDSPLKLLPHVLTSQQICTWDQVDKAILCLMEEICPD